MFAATAGWHDAEGRAKTAVVFFREAADGTVSNYSVVPAPGARAIATGPQDNAVVATLDPLHDGDTSLVTVVNANGNVLATWGQFQAPSVAAANDRIAGVRLYQIDRGRSFTTIGRTTVTTPSRDAAALPGLWIARVVNYMQDRSVDEVLRPAPFSLVQQDLIVTGILCIAMVAGTHGSCSRGANQPAYADGQTRSARQAG